MKAAGILEWGRAVPGTKLQHPSATWSQSRTVSSVWVINKQLQWHRWAYCLTVLFKQQRVGGWWLGWAHSWIDITIVRTGAPWLVQVDHMTWILASDWSIVRTGAPWREGVRALQLSTCWPAGRSRAVRSDQQKQVSFVSHTFLWTHLSTIIYPYPWQICEFRFPIVPIDNSVR